VKHSILTGGCAAAAVIGLAVGCAGHPTPRPASWTIELPSVQPPTLEDSLKIIDAAPGDGPSVLPIGTLSAAVFARGDATLDTSNPEWKSLENDLCGQRRLLAAALSHGWDVSVTGFIDSSGSMGPGTLNAQLPMERARTAVDALRHACAIPVARIVAKAGGVDGPGAAARRVVVTYERPMSGARG